MPAFQDAAQVDFCGGLECLYGTEQGTHWAVCRLRDTPQPAAGGPKQAVEAIFAAQPGQQALVQLICEPNGDSGNASPSIDSPQSRAGRASQTSTSPQSSPGNFSEAAARPSQCENDEDISLTEYLAELAEGADCGLDASALGAVRLSQQQRCPNEGIVAAAERAISSLSPACTAIILGDRPEEQEDERESSQFDEVPRSKSPGLQANLLPVLGVFRSGDCQRLYLVHPLEGMSLADVLRFCPQALGDQDCLRLLLFQLLSGLQALHSRGIAHGSINPAHVFLTATREVKLTANLQGSDQHTQSFSLAHATEQWRHWKLFNYEYLLQLNQLAGRRLGDSAFHPILPWVLDMTAAPDADDASSSPQEGWRDLSKTKWRLAKGDEQLDFTFASSDPPHHISDEALSELTYCIYKARRLPKTMLTRVVRTVFEGNEYPATMQRLFAWSPDECIPEFYSDSSVFTSLHADMADLAVPGWAASPEDFIKKHRAALESERVSQQLHLWIDLMFGHELSGAAAVAAKNVSLPPPCDTLRSTGRAQLFQGPHPVRMPSPAARQPHVSFTISDLQLLESRYSEPGSRVAEPASADPMNSTPHSPDRSPSWQRPVNDSAPQSGPPSSSGRSNGVSHDGQTLGDGLKDGFWRDIVGIGVLTVQLLQRRLLFVPWEDGFWEQQAGLLSASNQHFVRACLSGRPPVDALLRSNFFPDHVRVASEWLGLRQAQATLDQRAAEVADARFREIFLRSPKALILCLPALTSMLTAASTTCEEHGSTLQTSVAGIVNGLLDMLPPKTAAARFLPSLAGMLRGSTQCGDCMRGALLQPSVLLGILDNCGLGPYMDTMHPAVVSCLEAADAGARSGSGGVDVPALAAQALCILAPQLGLPVTVEHVLRPLLLRLPGAPHIALALIGVASALGPLFAARHLLPPLLAVLTSPDAPLSFGGDAHARLAAAQLNAITALEGLLPQLPPGVALARLVSPQPSAAGPEQPSPLVATLLQPDRHAPASTQHRNRFAALLLQACKLAGNAEVVVKELLPQLLPLFSCPSSQRRGYGSSLPQAAPPAASLGPASARREQEDSGYWDLIYILYPELTEAAGSAVLRELVPAWPQLERVLEAKYGWKAMPARGLPISEARRVARSLRERAERLQLGTSKEVVSEPGEKGGEALRRVQHTAMLIDGIGWSMPAPQQRSGSHQGLDTLAGGPQRSSGSFSEDSSQANAPPMPRSPSGQLEDTSAPQTVREPFWPLDALDSSEASTSGREWHWLPHQRQDDATCWGNLTTWTSHPPRPPDGVFWGRPWRLQAAVVQRWRAHREGLTALLLHPNEQLAVTCGRGHPSQRAASVLRCWRVSDAAPGVQYRGHTSAVTSMCMLPAHPARVASCDQGGSIHIWSTQSGAQVHAFHSPASPSRAQQRAAKLAPEAAAAVAVYDLESEGSDEEPASPAHAWTNVSPARARPSPIKSGQPSWTSSAASLSWSSLRRGGGSFTCVATGGHAAGKDLAAGTEGGQVRWLDVVSGVARASLLCGAAGRLEAAAAVTVVQQDEGGEMVAAGMSGGQVGIMDARLGRVVASWCPHQAPLTALCLLPASCGILTASQDPMLKLWDLRKTTASSLASTGQPSLLAGFQGPREGVGGVAVHGGDAICFAGPHIGVCSLQPPFSERMAITRPLNLRGGRDSSNLVGLGLLPYSRLLVLASEDGQVKICC